MKKQGKPYRWDKEDIEDTQEPGELLDDLENIEDLDDLEGLGDLETLDDLDDLSDMNDLSDLEDLGDLGDLEDDEIIDLEEVVELPEKMEEEGAPGDAPFGLEGMESERFLDSFADEDLRVPGFDKEAGEDGLFDEDSAGGLALMGERITIGDDESLELREMDLDEPSEAERADGEMEDFSALMGFAEKPGPAVEIEKEVLKADVADTVPPMEMMGMEEDLPAVEPSVDDLVSRIEGRLVETLQQMVEARLPDIVRAVLRDEIEQLKRGLEETQNK